MLQLPAAERWAVKHFDDRNRAVDSTNQQAVHAQTKTSLDQSLTLRPRQSRDPVWLDIQVTAMTAFILHHTKTDTLLPLPQVIHTKRSRVGQPFYVSVCLSVCHSTWYLKKRWSKDHQPYTQKCSTTSLGKLFICGFKRSKAEVTKHRETLSAWVIALLLSDGFFQRQTYNQQVAGLTPRPSAAA